MDYSSAVRQRFARPAAADTSAAMTGAVTGTADDRSLNVWVRFSVEVADDGVIAAAAFNAFGCPHLIAACDWAAGWLRGREWSALETVPIEHLAQELGVPREKFGKLLRIEDALGECAAGLRRKLEANGGE